MSKRVEKSSSENVSEMGRVLDQMVQCAQESSASLRSLGESFERLSETMIRSQGIDRSWLNNRTREINRALCEEE